MTACMRRVESWSDLHPAIEGLKHGLVRRDLRDPALTPLLPEEEWTCFTDEVVGD